MPRKRMINPDFFASESLAECSYAARLCFIGLWCQAKDDGRSKFTPRSLKCSIFPMDEMTMEEFLHLLCELEIEGCIRFYASGGEAYFDIPNFNKYQTISRPTMSGFPEYSMSTHVSLHEHSMSTPPKELIKELINEKAPSGEADAPLAALGGDSWEDVYSRLKVV